MDNGSYWYNFDKREYEYIETPDSVEVMRSYVPDVPEARNMYDILVELGNDPVTANAYVTESIHTLALFGRPAHGRGKAVMTRFLHALVWIVAGLAALVLAVVVAIPARIKRNNSKRREVN